MRTLLQRGQLLVLLITLPIVQLGCETGSQDASVRELVPGGARLHPDSLERWVLPGGSEVDGGTPSVYRLEELRIGPDRFDPLRARYLQTMYDAPGEPGSRLLVTIQLDRAVQSGPWDGSYPALIPGLREPGLIVDWQIQNAIYNAFDRLLTDENLGTRQRVMPGGSTVAGLVIGAVVDGVHRRLVADAAASPAAPGGTDEAIARVPLPDATVNVLTAPLLVSQLEVSEGDVFTLPGYALIGGPGGVGTRWTGVYEVIGVSNGTLTGGAGRVVELVTARRPEDWIEASDIRAREGRITRLLVTSEPPYLLAREDYQIDASGAVTPIREHLHLVDWAPLPLPGADLVPDSLWRIELDRELFNLDPSSLPRIHPLGR